MDLTRTVVAAALAALLALFLLLPLDRSSRTSDRAGPRWAGAWTALGCAGVLASAGGDALALRLLARLLDGAFAALLLAGAFAFVGRALPRWFWLATLALTGVQATLGLAFSADESVFWGSLAEAPLLAAAAALLWGSARATRAGVAERALAALVTAVAALEVFDSFAWADGAERGELVAWLALALATALTQLLVFGERARRRETRLRAHRALLSKVAASSIEPGAARDALARVAAVLTGAAPIAVFGIWRISPDGTHYELAEGGGPLPVPDSMREPSSERPLLRAAAESPGPLFVAPSLDPRVSDPSCADGLHHAFVAPLRIEGRLVGFLAGGLEREADDDERLLIGDLADEVALVVANVELRETLERRTRDLDAGQRLLRATVDGVPVGIVMTDPQGKIELLNRNLAEQIGIEDPATWHGRTAFELAEMVADRVDPEQRAVLEREMAAYGTSPDAPTAFELRISEPEERVLAVRAEPVVSSAGRELGRVTVTVDVTHERRIAQRMQQAERMETVGTLAGGLAHDFNNQLTAILGNARLVLEKLAPGDPKRGPLLDLERSAEHCAELTQGLLAFARQGSVSRAAVPIEVAIAEVDALLRPTLEPEVVLRSAIEPGTPSLAANAFQLRRVLVNLVSNGRDAVRGRGTIEVWARLAEPHEGDAGAVVELGVRDDGVGMDEPTRTHIFDPFFTTKELGRGTGLGLAIVYGIVAAHGGSIEVESAPGRGSSFRVRWPAARREAAAASTAVSHQALRQRHATILVAEDEPSVRRLTRATLEGAGHRVLEASDGDQAVERFAAHRHEIDLVVLDLSMPHRNGLDALLAMRASEPRLRALVMSGHPDRERWRPWPERVVVLPKPFGPRALLASIDELLSDAAPALAEGR